MGTLSALLLAAPIFGFALIPPATNLTSPEGLSRMEPAAFVAVPRLLLEVIDAPEAGGAPAESEEEAGEENEENEENETAAPDAEGEAAEAAAPDAEEEASEMNEVDEENETAAPDAEEEAAEMVASDAEEEAVEMAAPAPPRPAPTPEPAPMPPLAPLGSVADRIATTDAEAAPSTGETVVAEALRADDRGTLRRRHRAAGIVTWVAMATTLTLGAIQFNDEYGASEYSETRCARGTAVLGQANCEVPYFHLMSALGTAALYVSTFALSSQLGSDESMEEQRRTNRSLRRHRTMRWVHGALMAVQFLEGIILGAISSAIDSEDNYSTLRGLTAFHLGVGVATFGVFSAAGAMMF